ncbi:MAG: dihydrofolate reductase [Sphingobium sp.]|jgi:dihydrofolate reductase|nr:dihydrofolate reductase [Sphingobium sp.]MCI1272027.1 dihydrofolate reductase [Sphingobium sp.]MCI1757091.1 dihydrofolate reductase [Sphingobium sp.]MCI2052786.1 dihydrofolate reductase [Sphingobium sp.]
MNHPEIVLILARADNGVIGHEGRLPWHLPADLRHFKALTQGTPMVMGRKTFESLPGLLEGRRHIVLTRDTAWQEDGAEVAHSVEDALHLANAPHISIIGGAEIYAQFLPHADRIELTLVHIAAEGDTHIDLPDPAIWIETAREDHPAENTRPAYSFVTLRRAGQQAG